VACPGGLGRTFQSDPLAVATRCRPVAPLLPPRTTPELLGYRPEWQSIPGAVDIGEFVMLPGARKHRCRLRSEFGPSADACSRRVVRAGTATVLMLAAGSDRRKRYAGAARVSEGRAGAWSRSLQGGSLGTLRALCDAAGIPTGLGPSAAIDGVACGRAKCRPAGGRMR